MYSHVSLILAIANRFGPQAGAGRWWTNAAIFHWLFFLTWFVGLRGWSFEETVFRFIILHLTLFAMGLLAWRLLGPWRMSATRSEQPTQHTPRLLAGAQMHFPWAESSQTSGQSTAKRCSSRKQPR